MKPDSDLASGSVHPFRAFWETGDLEVWIDAVEPNVELHSPAFTTPFRGREVAAELYGVLFETLDEFEIIEESAAGDAYACRWHANVGGRRIEGADFICFKRRALALDCFTRYFGAPAAAVRDYGEKIWPGDPWACGCYGTVLPPGVTTELGPDLSFHFGRVQFAGADLEFLWNGHMEGAVRAGDRATRITVDQLDRRTDSRRAGLATR